MTVPLVTEVTGCKSVFWKGHHSKHRKTQVTYYCWPGDVRRGTPLPAWFASICASPIKTT